MRNYTLDSYKKGGDSKTESELKLGGFWQSTKEFFVYIKGDEKSLIIAMVAVLLSSAAGVITPYLVAKSLDSYIIPHNLSGLGFMISLLVGLYVFTAVVGYLQSRLMGHVSRRTLFRLRSALFDKLQDLPIAFFNQNKAGDLISRLNNDTDKLNQFLSESVVRLAGSLFVVIGIGTFVLFVNFVLGLIMLSMVLFIVIVTKASSVLVEKMNAKGLQSVGSLSASLQENLTNFRVIVAYSKREYFKKHLAGVAQDAFKSNFIAQALNKVFEPIYDFAGVFALIFVLLYGMHLVSLGALSIGLLIAFVSYTQKFYEPLRALSTIFGTVQLSFAAWARIRIILNMQSDLVVLKESELQDELNGKNMNSKNIYKMELRNVDFGYREGVLVLENINVAFEEGKTYALVGPTGGGKSTFASVMDRLYDPVSGVVLLDGKDIRTYEHGKRSKIVSIILQDPILFSGTVGDNLRYGNEELTSSSDEQVEDLLKERGLSDVISRFDKGLATVVTQGSGSGLSLGQKQLVSFMRAILRQPQVLILDEATANIDTVTEAILEKALDTLPASTTKIIIAHRLNTIQKADEILFVNAGHVLPAGSFEDAIKLIENAKRKS